MGGEDVISFTTTRMNETEGEEKNMLPGHGASASDLRETTAPAKSLETIHSLTPSHVTIVNLVIPQGIGGALNPKTNWVTSQGLMGREARKTWDRQRPEGQREENGGSRHPSPNQQEEAREANRLAATAHAGQGAPRLGLWERLPGRPLTPRREEPPLDTERYITTAGVPRSQSPQEQGYSRVGSPRILVARKREPPREPKPLTLSHYKEVQDLYNISDTTSVRCQTSSDAPEAQEADPSSSNQPLSSNTQDRQGSKEKCQQLHEREARPEISQGERRPHQYLQERQVHSHDRSDGQTHQN